MIGSRGCRGFTLIEVILSIMILALGIVSVQRVFVGSLSGLSVIENWGQAERLLEEKIWSLRHEVQKQGRKFKKHNDGGLVLGNDRTFHYKVSLRKIAPDDRLREARAIISWGHRGLNHSIKRTFYLRVPYAEWKN